MLIGALDEVIPAMRESRFVMVHWSQELKGGKLRKGNPKANHGTETRKRRRQQAKEWIILIQVMEACCDWEEPHGSSYA